MMMMMMMMKKKRRRREKRRRSRRRRRRRRRSTEPETCLIILSRLSLSGVCIGGLTATKSARNISYFFITKLVVNPTVAFTLPFVV